MGSEVQMILSALIGALTAGIPLYAKIRSINLQFKKDGLKVDADAVKLQEKQSINKEAEWKRILDERAAAEAKLRERDDEQERKISDLLSRFIESERSGAAKDERIKMLGERIDFLTKLLLQRCPECPSLKNSTPSPSGKFPVSLPGPTETPAA